VHSSSSLSSDKRGEDEGQGREEGGKGEEGEQHTTTTTAAPTKITTAKDESRADLAKLGNESCSPECIHAPSC
jgi:hypothetical protein